MAGGYTVADDGEYGKLVRLITEIQTQIRELGRPTGGQLADQLATLQGLVDGLVAQVNGTFSGYVSAGGNMSTGADLTVVGKIRNVSAYSNPITTSFRNLFVTSVDGQFGFNLSSRKHKRDIRTAKVSAADVLKLRLVTYRYKAAVEEHGSEAKFETGFIAEEVEEAGLGWLVDYDENGDPLTLKFHLIGMAMLVVAQDQERRLAELERLVADRNPA